MRFLLALLLPWLQFFHHRQAHFRIGLLAFAADRYRLDTGRIVGLRAQPSI